MISCIMYHGPPSSRRSQNMARERFRFKFQSMPHFSRLVLRSTMKRQRLVVSLLLCPCRLVSSWIIPTRQSRPLSTATSRLFHRTSPAASLPHRMISPPGSAGIGSRLSLHASAADDLLLLNSSGNSTVPFILLSALLLGFGAQYFINTMLSGDQGLGAFLKDGRGYQKSAFQPGKGSSRDNETDPLPWLKLPSLPYVDVKGQQSSSSSDDVLLAAEFELETLKRNMSKELELGNVEEATRIREKLEEVMYNHGFQYEKE